jgi:O-antigen ligase
VVLALGLAAHGRSPLARAVAAASLPLLVPTLYFTFSRGAWIALAAALVVVVALSSRRLQLVSTLLVQSGPAGSALALAYRSKPLRRLDSSAAQTVHAGHRLAVWLVLLVLAAAAVTVLYGWVARSVRFPEAARRAYAVFLAGIALAGVGVALVHYGGPVSAASQLRKSFTGGSPAQSGDLSKRLFTLSSPARVEQWHVAVREWKAHPVLGSGAGTYAEYWTAARDDRGKVLDAHNLYLEVLAELGPIGLVLLVAALLVPLLAAVRARDRALTAAATGAYVAWLVHVAYDWDWELPGVTAAALLCAGAVLAAHRGRARRISATPARWALVVIIAVVGVAATLGLLGNRALARSGAALRNGDFVTAAAAARDARRWAPWSAQPWQQLAAVRLAQGDVAAARDAYRKAVAKDPRDWQLWLGLASVSRGAERGHAVEQLTSLNPAAAAVFKQGPP